MTPLANRGDGPPITILFVDDEPAILRAITRALSGSPFDVLSAPSAADALALLRQRPVDVLVSDIDMPGMSGLELVAVVRREWPAMLRMVLTGAGTMARALEAINDGEVHRFFHKPFDFDVFRATMTALVERIAKIRHSGQQVAREARREEFFRWVEATYPGTLDVCRNERGEILVDAPLRELGLLDESPRSGSSA